MMSSQEIAFLLGILMGIFEKIMKFYENREPWEFYDLFAEIMKFSQFPHFNENGTKKAAHSVTFIKENHRCTKRVQKVRNFMKITKIS